MTGAKWHGRRRLLPRCPRLAEGLHNLRVLDAIVAAATNGGREVTVTNEENR